MEGRVKVNFRPFARSSRSAELAAAVSAPPVKPGTAGVPSAAAGSAPSSTVTSAASSSSSAGPSSGVKSTVPPARASASASSSSAAAAAVPPPQPVIAQEYSVRVPKTNLKPISIMRFNGALGVDPSKWTSLKMAREDNSRLHKTAVVPEEDNMPKFGAGSEYGREAREEAKRKKYGGGNRKKYNIEEQPWIMKASDKGNRKYRGVKEGGVSENASYYIFTQAVDGGFEVFPVNHWYNFTPIQRYKSLTAEEAEEQFGRRNKIYNYFSVMVRKRLKADEEHEGEGEEAKAAKGSKKKASSGLKVSEMEDWDESDQESEDDSDKDEGEKKAKKKKPGKPKKKKGSDEEAEEDSDDGDGEGRELDYISDTSETESEEEKEKKNDEIGVDQEAGLKNLLDSDSDEEETKVKEDVLDDEEEGEEGAEKKGDANGKKAEEAKDTKKKSKKKPKPGKGEGNPQENLSDEDEDDDKIVDELDNAIESAKLEAGASGSNAGSSRDGTPDVDAASGSKRKASSDIISGITNASKKAKMEVSPSLVQSAAAEGITEEAVRRYLLRKPMTVTELLQKFKSKKTKIQSHDMVNVIAHILKKINPVKRMQSQKMYLYLSNKA